MPTLAELRAQAIELDAKIKAEEAKADAVLVRIPLRRADGVIVHEEVSFGSAKILMDRAFNATSPAQNEGKDGKTSEPGTKKPSRIRRLLTKKVI
jgi:hypothetical protein